MILVTGPTGNIGSLLVQELLQRKAAVRALVRDSNKEKTKARCPACARRGDRSGRPGAARLPAGGPCKGRERFPAHASQPGNGGLEGRTSSRRRARPACGTSSICHRWEQADDAPFSLGRWHWQAEQELEASGVAWTRLRTTDLARCGAQAFHRRRPRARSVLLHGRRTGRVAMVDEADVPPWPPRR